MSRARSTLLVLVGATLVLGAQAAKSGSSGIAFDPSAASSDVGYALALQRDGVIVLAGISRRGGREVIAVVRYRRSGAVDPSFGAHGIVLTAPANGRAAATAVAAQDDGRLVVAGGTFLTERQSVFALARYTRSGKLDATFGHSGAVLTAFAAPPRPGKFALASAEDLALQPDGRIVAVGGTSNIVDRMQLAVARYTTTGALDSSFGRGGKVVAPLNTAPLGGVGAVALQRDGKIVVAGTTLIRVGSLSESRFALERFTPRGALDVRFGSAGKVVAPPIGYWDRAPDVAIQKDGKIVVVGAVDLAMRHRQLGLARFLPSGELDTGLGDGGTVVTNFAVLGDAALAIQPDGKIVAACGLDGPRRFGVARYEIDGTLDAGFGDGGKVRTRFPQGAAAHAVLVQPDGKIVVGGSSGYDFALARYTTDGSLDAGFGRGGTVTTPLGAAWATQVVLPDRCFELMSKGEVAFVCTQRRDKTDSCRRHPAVCNQGNVPIPRTSGRRSPERLGATPSPRFVRICQIQRWPGCRGRLQWQSSRAQCSKAPRASSSRPRPDLLASHPDVSERW